MDQTRIGMTTNIADGVAVEAKKGSLAEVVSHLNQLQLIAKDLTLELRQRADTILGNPSPQVHPQGDETSAPTPVEPLITQLENGCNDVGVALSAMRDEVQRFRNL